MHSNQSISRRTLVKSSIFGLLTVSIPSIVYSNEMKEIIPLSDDSDKLFYRYPSIDDEIVSSVVGASHFDLDKVKKLVNERPELARATWDWSFGDWETAIGAASHVGRRDIADFLISKGARPDIFTYAMFGEVDTVKSMIESCPGVQKNEGPHGISLLVHAKIGLRRKAGDETKAKQLVEYLESLGDADSPVYMEMTEAEMEKYLGDYKYGDGEKEGFSLRLNSRKMLSLGKLGNFGGGLLRMEENKFRYNGTSSVFISFSFSGDKVVSLTVTEPGLTLTAKKV